MAQNHFINIKKYSKILDKLVSLNNQGIFLLTNKTSDCIASGCTKLEFLEGFKKDIDKTIQYLLKVQPLIYSAKNGIVTEYEGLDKSVETVFGETYNSNFNTVSLCGVDFDLNKKSLHDKAKLKAIMLKNLFGIDAKNLSKVAKALKVYEDKKEQIEKDLLYPSIELADKIIEKITSYEVKFNDFRSKMDKRQYDEYTATFNRSGITDVIQASSYIIAGDIKQTSSTHKKSELLTISEYIRTSKYFEAIEIDPDGDPLKVLKAMKQIDTTFKLNVKNKFTFKVRKLGNYKVNGLYIVNGNIVAIDVRETSAMLHEIAHLIHLQFLKENKFIDYMIDKLSARLDFNNLSEDMKVSLKSKIAYYSEPVEVLARGCEIAALFALEDGKWSIDDDSFMVIKDRFHYENLEGIYFNFTSFDKELKDEMKKLYELFFETSPEIISNSEIDNFKKIDTEYEVDFKREPSFWKKIISLNKKRKKELKAIFSMVNTENIECILNNAKTPIEELTLFILQNYLYIGGHKDKMTAKEWIEIFEDQAEIYQILFDRLRDKLSNKEFVLYIRQCEKEGLIGKISSLLTGLSFSPEFRRMQFIPQLEKYAHPKLKKFTDEYLISFKIGAIAFADDITIKDKEFMREWIKDNRFIVKNLPPHRIDFDILKEYQKYAYACEIANFNEIEINAVLEDFEERIKKYPKGLGEITNDILKNDKDIARWIILSNSSDIYCLGDKLRNDKEFMEWAIDKGASVFTLGKKLLDDKEFIIPYVKKNPALVESLSSALKKDDDILIAAKTKVKVADEDISFFEKLIQEGVIEDFIHTKTKEILKVLKLKKRLSRDEFKAFNQYLKDNDIAYYSKFVKGFIIKNIDIVKVAASVSAIYSADILTNFANGTLF